MAAPGRIAGPAVGAASASLPLLPIVLVLALALAGGCGAIEEEDFSTDLVFSSPPDLGIGGTIEIRKRFRFSADPAAADRVTMRSATLTVLTDGLEDFAFLHYLDVYVIDDTVEPEERVLIARAPAFTPDLREVPLEVLYTDDLREFVHDQRVRMAFVIGPSLWFEDWPEGQVHLRGDVVLDLEVQ